MTPIVVTREEWGADPVVRSSDGSPRPPVDRPARWLTVHYTGNSSPLTTVDRTAVIAAQQALERFAVSQKKPNEYNYCLYSDTFGVGYVVEYAGAYRAAHSADENQQAVGVLFYVGVGQGAPDAMVDAYRYLRDRLLTPMGAIGPATAQTPHKAMPGAATPCPGPVLERWADLLAPYTTQGGAPMARQLVRCGNDPTGAKDTAWHAWVVHDAGKFWLPTGEALALAVAELGDPVDVSDDWMRAHGPAADPRPTDDPWGAWTPLPS